MPPRKAAPAPKMIPTKDSFFLPKRPFIQQTSAIVASKPIEAPKPPPIRRYLYDKGTDMAYAEIVGNAAICLETGMELFRFGDRDEEYRTSFDTIGRSFDFSPPEGKKHPDDKSIDVRGLVKAGIISDVDVANHRAFSAEELQEGMKKLEEFKAHVDGLCAFGR